MKGLTIWLKITYNDILHHLSSRPSYVVKNCPTVGNSPIIPSPPWCFFMFFPGLLHHTYLIVSPIYDWNLKILMWDLTPFFFGWWQYDHNEIFIDINYTYRRSTILSCLGFVDWLRSQVWAMHRHPRQLELKWINIQPKQNWWNTLHTKLLSFEIRTSS